MMSQVFNFNQKILKKCVILNNKGKIFEIKKCLKGAFAVQEKLETLLMGVSLIFAAIIFVYLQYNLYFNWKTRKQKLIEVAEKNGWIAQGRCVKYRYTKQYYKNRHQVKNYIIKVKYEYVVDGRKYYKKIKYRPREFTFPRNVVIYYNANNPKKAACAHEAKRKESGCLIPLVVAILTVKIMFTLLSKMFIQ